MRVTTPIADLDITIQSLRVQAGALVMESGPKDAMPTRAALQPSDVRRLLFLMLQREVIGFALKSLFCAPKPASRQTSHAADDHPTAHPW